jgi:hypothetical protein
MSSSGQPLAYTAWAPHGAMTGPRFGPPSGPYRSNWPSGLPLLQQLGMSGLLLACTCAHTRLQSLCMSGLPLDIFLTRAACRLTFLLERLAALAVVHS